MSYYRIGERNTRKLIERASPLIRLGVGASETLRPVRLSPEAAERLRDVTGGRTPLLDTAAVDAAVGPLYPLYREPEAHHVAYRQGATSVVTSGPAAPRVCATPTTPTDAAATGWPTRSS